MFIQANLTLGWESVHSKKTHLHLYDFSVSWCAKHWAALLQWHWLNIKFLQLHHTSQNMCLDFQMCIPSQRQEAITSISSLSIPHLHLHNAVLGQIIEIPWHSSSKHTGWFGLSLSCWSHMPVITQGPSLTCWERSGIFQIPTLHFPGLLQAAVNLVRQHRSRKSQQPQNSRSEQVNTREKKGKGSILYI